MRGRLDSGARYRAIGSVTPLTGSIVTFQSRSSCTCSSTTVMYSRSAELSSDVGDGVG